MVGQASQKAENVVASTYLGKGKVAEIRDLAQGLGAKVLIVNDELTPVQIRNLEHITKLRVIDRTELILEIFQAGPDPAGQAAGGAGAARVRIAAATSF